MDDGLGRDIAPDEERLNYVYNNNNGHQENDLQEDRAMGYEHPENHNTNPNPISHSIRHRGNFRIQEPVDTTPDAVGTIYHHVFPEERYSGASAPNYYKSEANRLNTFSDWRYEHVVRRGDLAKNGFVFTGSGDKVRCVYCNGILRQWEVGDVVEEEHRRNFPRCPFLLGTNVGNIPLPPNYNPHLQGPTPTAPPASHRVMNGEGGGGRGHDIDPVEEGYGPGGSYEHDARPCSNNNSNSSSGNSRNIGGSGGEAGKRHTYSNSPRNPAMAVEPDRLATFGSWPAQMKQKPEELAQAGLYYVGDGDKVKCFHCDGLLYNWEPTDDPFVEHARWFPDCQYLRLVKGDNFVEDVQQGRVTAQEELMQTPAVLAVLYEGHSVDSVQKALAVMREKNGANVVVSAQNLLMTIMELENDKTETLTQNGHASSEDSQMLASLQRENESLKDRQQCKVCMEREVEVIFLPCRHLVCCAPCGAALPACPICRIHIESIDKIFMV